MQIEIVVEGAGPLDAFGKLLSQLQEQRFFQVGQGKLMSSANIQPGQAPEIEFKFELETKGDIELLTSLPGLVEQFCRRQSQSNGFRLSHRSSISVSGEFPPPPSPLNEDANIPVDDVLSTRVASLLRRVGIETLGDLVERTEWMVKVIPSMGPVSMREIEVMMAQRNLTFRAKEG